MAIKVNNTTVIDDSKNLVNVGTVTFNDATVLTSAPTGGTVNIGYNNIASYITLDNPNAYSISFEDNFGVTVGISGNYAIVGAYFEDDAGGTTSGKAYIFNVTTGALVHTLDNPNAYSTSGFDRFGYSVSMSGNYAIVGALDEDDSGGTQSGKAYIFNVTTGALLHTLDNPNAYSTSGSDNFGNSVGISGDYAIVGAFVEDDSGGTSSGKVYIFNATTGALVHTLDNPNAFGTSSFDFFGYSVAISGNYAIVGAYAEDDGGTSSGKAYIFNVATGALVHTLDNPNAYGTSLNDYFGWSVSMSGNYAIVGASQEDDAGGNSSGKAYIFDVATGALLHTLDNPNAYSTSGSDFFGYSVAISSNYAIVSAYLEDDSDGLSSGKAYIFDVTTGVLVYTLDNPNAFDTSADDNFGRAVAISGNYAIVGANTEDELLGGAESGKAYLFPLSFVLDRIDQIELSDKTFLNKDNIAFKNASFNATKLLHTLDNPNAYGTSVGDNFGGGLYVAISGNYAIVGANQEDDSGGTGSGKAYIFNVTTGVLLHTLDNPNAYDTSLNDNFGVSVAISGNYAIVGAYAEDDSAGSDSGKAYIFDVATGALLHTLDNPNAYGTSAADNFGYSVAISGNYAIVGAYQEDDGPLSSGKAYIFNVTTGALLHTLDNPNAYDTSLQDYFGFRVAIDGNYAIVGAYGEDDSGGSGSGKAYIFDITTGALVHTLNNPNAYSTSAGDNFGFSVAISGNYAIVGAYLEDDAGGGSSGKAYIFNVVTGTLVHTLDNPNAYDTSASDFFGFSVAISGNYAIVGAYGEDDSGGLSSGKAYIFNVTTGALLHTLDNPNAYSTSASDLFGQLVAIDGNYAIVGARSEDDSGGSGSGKAYMYYIDTNASKNRTVFDKLITLF
jgi:hypothetical protein